MRRRRGDGLVSCGRAAPAGVEVVLARARDAPTTATRPGGRWRRVRVRVRLRGCVREAGGAVAIELQGGGGSGVAAADLRREVTVVVSGIDGLAHRSRGRRGRRLVLGVQRVHEVRAHRGGGGRGPREGGPGRAGGRSGAGRERASARLHCRGGLWGGCSRRWGRRVTLLLLPPARAWPLRLGSRGRSSTGRSCPAFAPAASASRRLSRGSRGLTQPPRSPPSRPLSARAGSTAI